MENVTVILAYTGLVLMVLLTGIGNAVGTVMGGNATVGAMKKKDDAFYEGIVKSLQYFANSVLPSTHGKMEAILACDGAVVEVPEDAFAS